MAIQLLNKFYEDREWMYDCNCSCTMAESPDFNYPGEIESNPICVNNTLYQDGFLQINKREWFWTLEVAGILLYFPLLVFAVHNIINYVIRQERYKQKTILIFYILTVASITLRLGEFGMLTVYYYCNIMVINVA